MTMITCLILWMPGGATYVPPVTRSDEPAFGLGEPAVGPDDAHAASSALVSTPAAATRASCPLRRLVPNTAFQRYRKQDVKFRARSSASKLTSRVKLPGIAG